MAATVHVLGDHAVTLAEAAELMLARRDLSDSSVRAYRATYQRVEPLLGDRALVEISQADLHQLLVDEWGECAPATYNRHRAALSSLFAWTRRGSAPSGSIHDALTTPSATHDASQTPVRPLLTGR